MEMVIPPGAHPVITIDPIFIVDREIITLKIPTGLVAMVNRGNWEADLMEENSSQRKAFLTQRNVLLISIFVAGLCSIVYELLIGTTSSYFLGDSVKHFSLTIGVYMAAMGLGSYLSRFIDKNLVAYFVGIEIILAVIGGLSVPFLYLLFSSELHFMTGMLFCISAIGILTGFEVPLLSRILSSDYTLKENLSSVLSLDYVGALVATLAFPFLLLPFIGLFKTSLVFGMINLGVGVITIYFLRESITAKHKMMLRLSLIAAGIFITTMLVFSNFLLAKWEQGLYSDRIIDSRQSQYQKIVLTKRKDDIRMYLDGNLQFSSIDEYRYHEVLVHIPMMYPEEVKNVLVLGGGDGLAARELLKYPSIEKILIVDLDKEVSELCMSNRQLSKLNQASLESEHVQVLNKDAFNFVREGGEQYDLVIIDLPDPNNVAISRMYSKEFYHFLKERIADDGLFITQASSPYFSKKAFWCIESTIESAGYKDVRPLHVYVPSFGDWGFVMGSKKTLSQNVQLNIKGLRYLNPEILDGIFQFSNDEKDVVVELSSLDRPKVAEYYEEGWIYWK